MGTMSVCPCGPSWLFSSVYVGWHRTLQTPPGTLWPPDRTTHLFSFLPSPYTSELKVVFSATRIKDFFWRTQMSLMSHHPLRSLHGHPRHSSLNTGWVLQCSEGLGQRLSSTCACLQKARCWPLVPSAPLGTPSDARSS